MNVLLTHPSSELYGSDRMVLLTLEALVKERHTVTAVLPGNGPLTEDVILATVEVVDIPVLRKADLKPLRFVKLLIDVIKSQFLIAGIISAVNPDVVYVNTIVQPWWIAGAKLRGRSVVVHVREAEMQMPRILRKIINAPLLMADTIICNSFSTKQEIEKVALMSRKRVLVVYNGKDWSEYQSCRRKSDAEHVQAQDRLTVVGRLSPRKGQDIAIRALAHIDALDAMQR